MVKLCTRWLICAMNRASDMLQEDWWNSHKEPEGERLAYTAFTCGKTYEKYMPKLSMHCVSPGSDHPAPEPTHYTTLPTVARDNKRSISLGLLHLLSVHFENISLQWAEIRVRAELYAADMNNFQRESQPKLQCPTKIRESFILTFCENLMVAF